MADNDRDRDVDRTMDENSIGEILLRILVTAIVVGIAAFLTPGFNVDGIWTLLIASVVIGLLDYLIQKITGVDASPFGRGLIGFIVSVVILYATKFIVPGFNISVWGAIIGALVIGILDAIIPGRVL